MYEVQVGTRVGSEALLIVGVVVEYAAARLALGAAVRGDAPAPGRWALAQWLPLMTTALAALAMGQTQVAVALVFGSSVACLSLIPGLSGYVTPMQHLPAKRRVWWLVLPAAVLLLLAGFHGTFTWYHAVMLLVMGAAFLGVWTEHTNSADGPQGVQGSGFGVQGSGFGVQGSGFGVQGSGFGVPVGTERTNPAGDPASGSGMPTNSSDDAAPAAARSALPWVLIALVVAGIGAWAAARGTVAVGESSRRLTPGFLAATVLSPLLLLPALGTGTRAAQRGQLGELTTALCGTVLLNLCLLLPIIILTNFFLAGAAHLHAAHGLAPALAAAAQATPFPLITWRVDSVLLVVLSFALVPVAAGRFMPERFESLLLVAVYAAYLLAETAVAVRLI